MTGCTYGTEGPSIVSCPNVLGRDPAQEGAFHLLVIIQTSSKIHKGDDWSASVWCSGLGPGIRRRRT